MNNRGQIAIILFFVFLLLIVVVGFMGSMIVVGFDYFGDEITPIMQDLGVVGDTNLSEVAEYTFVPLNNVLQALPWLLGLTYIVALVASLIFVLGYTFSPNPVFIGFYMALIILLIFGAIVMSNMYQDIYEGDDEVGTRLQEQTVTSYMILYSPFILTLIAIIAGIFLFARTRADAGGFDV